MSKEIPSPTHTFSDPPEYRRFVHPHRRALARLRLDLDFFLEEASPIILISREERLKTFDSAVRKSRELGIAIEELDDLAGVRVVAGTFFDVETLSHFFKNGLRGTSFKVLKDNVKRYDEGYRARHIVIEVPDTYTGTWTSCKVEIQLQTAMESAFNKLSRLWVYKSGRGLPDDWQARFVGLARDLEALDRTASNLHRELFSASESLRDSDPLTPLAYQTLIKEAFDESTNDEHANWAALFYRWVGAETCGDLRSFLRRADIAELYERWRASQRDGKPSILFASNKHEFWETWGVRFEAAKKVLDDQEAATQVNAG